MASKIVVGVDGSHESDRAVAWTAAQAKATGAEVTVVHAVQLPVYAGYGEFGTAMVPRALSDSEREELHTVVERDWSKPLVESGVKFHARLIDGSPSAAIIAVAEEDDADLVVVGRRGRGGFKELVLGSTSHQLTHHVGRPLVLVP